MGQCRDRSASELMGSFGTAVTVPGLRLADPGAHLQALISSGLGPTHPWRGRWRVAATAGTTGRRGIFAWDTAEWPPASVGDA